MNAFMELIQYMAVMSMTYVVAPTFLVLLAAKGSLFFYSKLKRIPARGKIPELASSGEKAKPTFASDKPYYLITNFSPESSQGISAFDGYYFWGYNSKNKKVEFDFSGKTKWGEQPNFAITRNFDEAMAKINSTHTSEVLVECIPSGEFSGDKDNVEMIAEKIRITQIITGKCGWHYQNRFGEKINCTEQAEYFSWIKDGRILPSCASCSFPKLISFEKVENRIRKTTGLDIPITQFEETLKRYRFIPSEAMANAGELR